MRRRRVDLSVEKRLVFAMVVSDSFVACAASVFKLELLSSPHLKQIAKWCLDYHSTYGQAPKRAIEALYFTWADSDVDPANVEATYALLKELGANFQSLQELNQPYLLDQLGEYIAGRKLARLADGLVDRLHRGEIAEALREVEGFDSRDMRSEVGVDPFKDLEVWDRAFEQEQEPLLVFPGDAGRFLNHACVRDGLIGIQAPEKRGKTFWALEFVVQALRQRRRVAYFQVGDLTEGQIVRRLGCRLAGIPLWHFQCGGVRVPTAIRCTRGERGYHAQADSTTRTFKRPLTKMDCRRSIHRFMRQYGMAKGSSFLRVSVHPTASLTVSGLSKILDAWEVSLGFVADVIVVDYADILAPEDSRATARDATNSIWASLRRLSQERRCLVVTPTQADAQSYDRHTQTMANFSEDKRKLAHVTGMLGLNQIESEKSLGIMRLNWIVLRESGFNARRCLYVGYSFEIGNPLLCSRLASARDKD